MKLPSFPFAKKPKSDYFLALVLQDEKVNTFIFEKVLTQITILGRHEEYLENSIDEISFEELLDICDKTVSTAEEQTSKDLGILKTIFGLKQNWVSENKIKKEHLNTLQKISGELELSPIGFLTITDAIVNLIQKEEGAPPSAILADIGEKFVTVSLIKAGKIIETKTSEIHQSPVFTVDTLLKHLTMPEILPSKVYFVGDEELTQEFIGHQWSKSLPFLHLPQIINLPESFIENAFITGVAKEMEAEIVSEESFDVAQDKKEEATPPEISGGPKEEPSETEQKVEYLVDAQSLFGFVEGKDVAKSEPSPSDLTSEQFREIPEEVKEISTKNQILPLIIISLSFIKNLLDKLNLSILKNIPYKVPSSLRSRKKILILTLLFSFFLVSLGFYFFGIKANVILSVKPKIEELNQLVTFSTNKASSFEDNLIAGEFSSVELKGTTSKSTTGKKEVGERAKGTVTIFNSSRNTVTFPTQTVIRSSNGLNFLTLDKVTVASESADVPPKAGTANVNVEGEKFGTEYNLPSGTKFLSIGGNADTAAKNDNPFSGGTKKEITVVAKEDLAELEKNLSHKLRDEAKNQILNKLDSGKQILPDFITISLTSSDFDKKIGDEATKLNLEGKVNFKALVFERNTIFDYSEKHLVPQGSSINRENLKINFKNAKAKNERDVEAELNIEARILPQVNIEEVTSKISGKSFKEAESLLLAIPNITSVKITFSPNLPFLPKVFPRINKNIKIEILDNG